MSVEIEFNRINPKCSGLYPHSFNGWNCPICLNGIYAKPKLNWLQRRWNDILYWWNIFIN